MRFQPNRELLLAMPTFADDWLIVAGDVGESEEDLSFVLDTLTRRFAKIVWVPGNHELYTVPEESPLRGQHKYERLVDVCRSFGAISPEDPYPTWPEPGTRLVIAPLFLLYDYTFRPESVPVSQAVAWAAEHDLVCTDEMLLHPDPFRSREAWCADRIAKTEARLAALPLDCRTILVNHFPLRYEHVTLPLIPRFSIWCGTRRTEDWHRRFRAECVVYGHLHFRGTRWRDGVRFEEVSLGYPRQWSRSRSPESYLRPILPASAPPSV